MMLVSFVSLRHAKCSSEASDVAERGFCLQCEIWDLVKTVSFRGPIMAESCTMDFAKFYIAVFSIIIIVIFILSSIINKKFWEELIAYFPLTRHGPRRKRVQ
jgi:hypothetical protein